MALISIERKEDVENDAHCERRDAAVMDRWD